MSTKVVTYQYAGNKEGVVPGSRKTLTLDMAKGHPNQIGRVQLPDNLILREEDPFIVVESENTVRIEVPAYSENGPLKITESCAYVAPKRGGSNMAGTTLIKSHNWYEFYISRSQRATVVFQHGDLGKPLTTVVEIIPRSKQR